MALEADLGKGIARHGGEDHVADHRSRRHHKAVENPAQGIVAEIEEGHKGFQSEPGGDEGPHVARGGYVGAKGGEDHIADGEQGRRRQDGEYDGDNGVAKVLYLWIM